MNNPNARLYSLKFCAAQCGMTPDLLVKACTRGDIPVTAIKVGDRGIWKIDAPQFLAWMNHPPHLAPLSNLFDN